jgi:hypothetical protein
MIFMKDRYLHSYIYRGIMELLARFGYVSIREVEYGFRLSLTKAVDRLHYLETQGFIQRFPSHTIPPSFFCLTSSGRQAVQGFNISEELISFYPRQYRLASQQHQRAIINSYLALKNALGSSFIGWISESNLKGEVARRILDGELHLKVRKTLYTASPQGDYVPALDKDPDIEDWCCGVEVEISLKSPARYKKQFKGLAHQYYNWSGKEKHYPMYLFIYGTQTIHDRLLKELNNHEFDKCFFLFVQIDELIAKQGDAILERWIGKSHITLPASDMTKVNVVVE